MTALVGGVVDRIKQIVERDDRALECDFAWILGADLIERLVCRCDRIFRRRIDCFGRLLPIRNGQNGVGLGRSRLKIVNRFHFGGRKRQRSE